MSVKSFKFVSPGVFIHEIDNSFIPKSADAIGPVVIGRAARGMAMQPVKVESYSHFVELYGDTVPGNGGGDVYRDGNLQSPMYGTYAAKAFLRSIRVEYTRLQLVAQTDLLKRFRLTLMTIPNILFERDLIQIRSSVMLMRPHSIQLLPPRDIGLVKALHRQFATALMVPLPVVALI